MDYRKLFEEENQDIRERYELVTERVAAIPGEHAVAEPFGDFFRKTAGFLTLIKETADFFAGTELKSVSGGELKSLNKKLYEDVIPESYDKSWANPGFAARKLGKSRGQVLSALLTDLRGLIPAAFECRLVDITLYTELFVQIYNLFEHEGVPSVKSLKEAIYWFYHDNCEAFLVRRTRELYDPELDFAAGIVGESGRGDVSYLYKYGEYVGENEIKTALFLESLPDEQIQKMADTFTEGYRLGFEREKKDLSKKGTVDIRYNIGFERIVKASIENFAGMGLKPVIYRGFVNSINGRRVTNGYASTGPNPQYSYDHRFDNALYLDKRMNARKESALVNAYEQVKELAALYAGPAVIEIFGEDPFSPRTCAQALSFDRRREELDAGFRSFNQRTVNSYIHGEERSFTIIAFPVYGIGDRFEEIFMDTVKINTLDQDLYRDVHGRLIDALDKAEYVRVKGLSDNKTDMHVCMHRKDDPAVQTNFENCLADVNIPLGEVFTSPRLTGTSGVLNVSRVYLNGLRFDNLLMTFEDGRVKDYTCDNFENEDDNRKYIKENILMGHETLPIGEFAIGTNTTAYMMAKKYDILYKLPILIVEKTGPHFAVGDTCFSWQEDIRTFNPDSKEIVAKDNEESIKRKEDVSAAYFNCHTDITIPYSELGEIAAVGEDGKETLIIRNGRFVLEGTEILNEPFDEE